MEHTNYAQTLSERILALRREKGMTQEALADQLGVSFQAVSKWENSQSCPDIALLPLLADIFHVSVDSLFGRETIAEQPAPESPGAPEINPTFEYCDKLPWPDDNTLRGVVAWGHKVLWNETLNGTSFSFDSKKDEYTWLLRYSPLNVECKHNLQVEGNIQGDVNAGMNINGCGSIGGNVNAGLNINSDGDIGNNANAGLGITCGDIGNNVNAGLGITCGDVGNNAHAGKDIECGNIEGNAEARRGNIECHSIGGDAKARKIIINEQ